VVLSGGQDSTVCLFEAATRFAEVHAITFNYGQRHSREIEAARIVARLAGVASHKVVDVGPILVGSSPLTNSEVELETYENFQQMDSTIGNRVELTFVPMRNAFFLNLAANHAVAAGIPYLMTGVCQADNANYPDCRDSFIKLQEFTINHALGLETEEQQFEILTPLMHLSKEASVSRLFNHGMTEAYLSLAYSHTSYDGQYPPVGKDHATTLRAQGFLEAGFPDPLVFRAYMEGLMELPDTPNYYNQGFLECLRSDLTMLATVVQTGGSLL
jgi:7-cyano-7-deazaguanine synthase